MRSVMTTAAVAVAAMAWLGAQTHPNLSGTWLPDVQKTAAMRPANAPGGGGGSGGGVARMGGGGVGGGSMGPASGPPETTITQTAAALTIERPIGGTVQRYIYKLDGSESTNVNGSTTLVTKSHWDGAKLVSEGKQSTKLDSGATEATFKETRYLDKDGDMVVETMRQFSNMAPVTGYQVLTRKK